MTRFFRTFACVILMFACSGVVVSQELQDVFNEFVQGYHNEFASSPEQSQNHREYSLASGQLIMANVQNHNESMQKRLNDLGPSFPLEERNKMVNEILADNQFTLRKQIAEKAREIFSDEQYRKMQQRQFQLRENIMRRLESFNDDEDILTLGEIEQSSFYVGDGQPDFLELTPEQRDLIVHQQKDMTIKIRTLLYNQGQMFVNNSQKEFFEKNEEIRQLEEKLDKIPVEMRHEEEAEAIQRQIKKIRNDMLKDVFPKLKEILLKSREDYMRVLTDAQKAKIKAVMAEMPDYMKNLFAEIDRQGGGLNILQLWQPGMGVPDFPNPNREAPRERPKSERAFPE